MREWLKKIVKASRTVVVTVIVLSFYGCGTGYVTQAVSEIAVRSTFPQSIGALSDTTKIDIIDSAGPRSHRIDATTCSLWADALVSFINDHRNNWYLARVNLAPGAASPESRGRFRIVFWQGDGRARVISFEDRRMETNHQGAVLYSQLNIEYAATLHALLFPKEEQWLVDRNTQVPCARQESSAVSVLALAASVSGKRGSHG